MSFERALMPIFAAPDADAPISLFYDIAAFLQLPLLRHYAVMLPYAAAAFRHITPLFRCRH